MEYDARRITVPKGFETVRRRPEMFFGKRRDDPELLTVAFSLAVQDALVEQPPEAPLRVRVVVEGPRAFTVEDNGPGIPVEPVRPGRLPALTEMMTELMVGYRWGMSMVTALCAEVVADVWRDGRHYRQRGDWTAVQGPLEPLEETDRHGTRVAYRLDDDYLDPAAEVPHDLPPLLESLFLLPNRDLEEAGPPAPGTSVELLDRRTGAQAAIEHRG